MAHVKLLVAVRDESGKQLRVSPVMNRHIPKVQDGFWVRYKGQRKVFPKGSFVLRYRQQPGTPRVYEVVGSDSVEAVAAQRKKEALLDAQSVGLIEIKVEKRRDDQRAQQSIVHRPHRGLLTAAKAR